MNGIDVQIILLTGAYFLNGYQNHMSLDDARRMARDFKYYKLNGGNSFYEYSFDGCELFIDYATVLSLMFNKPIE